MQLQSALSQSEIEASMAAARSRMAKRDIAVSGESIVSKLSQFEILTFGFQKPRKAERQRMWQRESMRRIRSNRTMTQEEMN